MSADDEMRRYLEMLLDHDCPPEKRLICPHCAALGRVYGLMQAEMFHTVVYPPMPASHPKAA